MSVDRERSVHVDSRLSLHRRRRVLTAVPSHPVSQGYDKVPLSFFNSKKVYYANTPNAVAEPTAAHCVRPQPICSASQLPARCSLVLLFV